MRRSSRNTFNFPDFSLRRLLLQGARAARGSPPLSARLCDVEKGPNNKNNGSGSTSSSNNNSHKNHSSDTASLHSGASPGLHSNNGTTKSTPNSQRTSLASSQNQLKNIGITTPSILECPLCYDTGTQDEFYYLLTCNHVACRRCLESYLLIEITESRTDIDCPQCTESMHPSDIQRLLKYIPAAINKYEDFMVRRVLLSDPDSRWCPAPDCSYAVIATGCASCPRLQCERCDVQFCYHCKAEWHPDQTCDAARASRQSPTRAPSGSISQDSQHRDDIKPCPRCQVLIVKMDDGSCNHMVCAVCGSEFCWLCMKEISDLHYLSPSGCTFWGKKPWSRKKKLLWQLGTLVGAPVGIALVAGIAVPAMIIGIPVWVGRKIHTRYKTAGKHKRNCAVLGGVTASVIVSPVLAGLAVAIGVPILLFYVYGVVPVSLCRAGCGVSTTRDGVKFEFDEEEDIASRNPDAASVDAVSRIGAISIGEVSLSVASGSQLGAISQYAAFVQPSNRESTTALAGSITGHRLEVQVDVSTSSSETASAVTCVSEKSSNTLNDTASTKALAGSILSYKTHMDSANFGSEDGQSERVRFDNTVCYVIDGKKESCDIWYTAPLDHDIGADKSSLGSGRSFRSSERSYRGDDMDSTSLSSMHNKRINFAQRSISSKLQHRNFSIDSNSNSILTSGSNVLIENVSLAEEHLVANNNNDSNNDLLAKNDKIIISDEKNTLFVDTKLDSKNASSPKYTHDEKTASDKFNSNELPKNNVNLINTTNAKTNFKLNNSQNEPNNKVNIILNNFSSTSSPSTLSTSAVSSSSILSNIEKPSSENKDDLNKNNAETEGSTMSPSSSNASNTDSKTVKRSNILRNLFFFQNEDGQTSSKT